MKKELDKLIGKNKVNFAPKFSSPPPASTRRISITPERKAELDRLTGRRNAPLAPRQPAPLSIGAQYLQDQNAKLRQQWGPDFRPASQPAPADIMGGWEYVGRSGLEGLTGGLSHVEDMGRLVIGNELQQAYKAGERATVGQRLSQNTFGGMADTLRGFQYTDFTKNPNPIFNPYSNPAGKTYIGRDERQVDMTDAMRKGANIPGNAWNLLGTYVNATKELATGLTGAEGLKNELVNYITRQGAKQAGISVDQAQQQELQRVSDNNFIADLTHLEEQRAKLAQAEPYQSGGARFFGNLLRTGGNVAIPIGVGLATNNPIAGLATMAISAGGQAGREALNAGATLDQAYQAGFNTAMKTAVLEAPFNGFPGIAGIYSPGTSRWGKYALNALGEAGEGAVDRLSQDYINKSTWNRNAPWTTPEELAQGALQDMAMSLLFQAPGMGKRTEPITQSEKNYEQFQDMLEIKSTRNIIRERDLILKDKQFGNKIGKHTFDYGVYLLLLEGWVLMRRTIYDIVDNADERIIGTWRGQKGPVVFYIKGNDVVITKIDGTFISILEGGIENARVKDARGR